MMRHGSICYSILLKEILTVAEGALSLKGGRSSFGNVRTLLLTAVILLPVAGCSQHRETIRSEILDYSAIEYVYVVSDLFVESEEEGILGVEIEERPLYRTRVRNEVRVTNRCPDDVKSFLGFSGGLLCALALKEYRTGKVVKGRDMLAMGVSLPVAMIWAGGRTHTIEEITVENVPVESYPLSGCILNARIGNAGGGVDLEADSDGRILLDLSQALSEGFGDAGIPVEILVPPPRSAVIRFNIPPHLLRHLEESIRTETLAMVGFTAAAGPALP